MLDLDDIDTEILDRPVDEGGHTLREALTGERHRDRPLEMVYGYAKDVFKQHGWHPAGQGKFRAVIRSIAANLVMAAKLSPTGRVSVSRSKKFYSDETRYRHTLYAYRPVIRAIAWMVANGLAVEHRAVGYAPNDPRATHLQTTLEATPKLLAALWHVAVERDAEHDDVRMRDARGVQVKVEETEQVVAMRAQMARVNVMVAGIVITMPKDCIELAPGYWKCPGKRGGWSYVNLNDLRMHRVFNRGDWACNGRAYGPHQNIPSALRSKRKGLRINGERCVELDFPSMHVTMLMARHGALLQHDPYDVDEEATGFPKSQGKITALVCLNARTRRDAVGAVKHGFEADGMTYKRASTLLDLVKANNPVIAADFHTDVGMGLMHDDAEIMLAVVEDLMAQGVPVLPVHDSFVVQRRFKGKLKAAMDRAMAAYIQRVWPVTQTVESSSAGSSQEDASAAGTAPHMGTPRVMASCEGPLMTPVENREMVSRARRLGRRGYEGLVEACGGDVDLADGLWETMLQRWDADRAAERRRWNDAPTTRHEPSARGGARRPARSPSNRGWTSVRPSLKVGPAAALAPSRPVVPVVSGPAAAVPSTPRRRGRPGLPVGCVVESSPAPSDRLPSQFDILADSVLAAVRVAFPRAVATVWVEVDAAA